MLKALWSEQADLVDVCAVDHAADRRHYLCAFHDEKTHFCFDTDITLAYLDFDAGRAQIIHHALRLDLSLAAPRSENDILRSVLGHPLAYCTSNPAGAAGDQIGDIGAEYIWFEGRPGCLECLLALTTVVATAKCSVVKQRNICFEHSPSRYLPPWEL